MDDFNTQWRNYLKDKNLTGGIYDNQAYKEFYRTKGLSAFNWEVQPIEKRVLNQHFTLYRFPDGSCLKISSGRNKVNHNSMRYYPSAKGLCFAERMLFGLCAIMPWDNEREVA